MKKLILTAALLAAITVGAKAQTTTPKRPIDSDLHRIEWRWERTDSTELIKNPDVRGYFLIDWKNETITMDEGDTHPFTFYISATKPLAKLRWDGRELTIYYHPNGGGYRYHTVRN